MKSARLGWSKSNAAKVALLAIGIGSIVALVIGASSRNSSIAVRGETARLTVTPTPSDPASPVRKAVRNQYGKGLLIEDVTTASDHIVIRYLVTGVAPIDFSQINEDPALARQGPTLLIVTVDGKALHTVQGTTRGETQSSVVQGEEVLQWSGGAPHHFHVAIMRIMGDTRATFTADFDL